MRLHFRSIKIVRGLFYVYRLIVSLFSLSRRNNTWSISLPKKYVFVSLLYIHSEVVALKTRVERAVLSLRPGFHFFLGGRIYRNKLFL